MKKINLFSTINKEHTKIDPPITEEQSTGAQILTSRLPKCQTTCQKTHSTVKVSNHLGLHCSLRRSLPPSHRNNFSSRFMPPKSSLQRPEEHNGHPTFCRLDLTVQRRTVCFLFLSFSFSFSFLFSSFLVPSFSMDFNEFIKASSLPFFSFSFSSSHPNSLSLFLNRTPSQLGLPFLALPLPPNVMPRPLLSQLHQPASGRSLKLLLFLNLVRPHL